MKYLPIFQECFESDSVIFLIMGAVFALGLSRVVKSEKKQALGVLISIVVYAVCEITASECAGYMIQLASLFVGTAAIGCTLGLSVVLLIFIFKKKREG